MNANIQYLGHSTMKLTLPDERVLMIDPWLHDNPACPDSEKDIARCDVVALTHAHFDHVGGMAALSKQHNLSVVAGFELAGIMESKGYGSSFLPMGIGGTQDVNGIQLTMTKAFHSSGYNDEDGNLVYAGMPGGFVIKVPGLATVYHAGDTDVFADMHIIEQLHEPRILMLPIGDLFTMGPKAAALATRYFNPSAIIPMHFGTFPVLTGTVAAFKDALGSDLASRVVALSPGERAAWTAEGLEV